MAVFELLKKVFDPDEPVPPDGSLEARIRLEEDVFYCSPVDVPEGSLIEVLSVTKYVYYEKENTAAINIIKAVDETGGDGKIYIDIDDENITDLNTMIAAVENVEAVMAATNFSINYSTTTVTGWEAGQQQTVVHAARNLQFLVTIQSVKRKLLAGGRDLYSIQAATIQLLSPQDLNDQLLEKVNNPNKPRKPTFEVD